MLFNDGRVFSDFGNVLVLSFLFAVLYITAFFLFYIFFHHGYPTAYTLSNEGIKIQFHKRLIAFIPYQIIENVTFNQEGPNFNKAMTGLGSFKDFTARKSKKYVLVETPFCTYYLSPSNPDKFKLELDNYTKNIINKDRLYEQNTSQNVYSSSLKTIFLQLFVKFPIGQMLLSLLIIFGMSILGYSSLIYPLIVIFIVSLNLVIYFFSSSIGPLLLGSHASDNEKIQLTLNSLKNKTAGPLPKIEIANSLIKGLNAFAAGSSPSRSVVILTESIENLPQDEIEAIIAHELGHIKQWHSLKLTLLSSFIVLLMFAIESTTFVLIFLFLALLTMGIVSKFFEKNADLFAARIVEPTIFSSALLKVGENAAYRLYTQGLTLSNPKPLDEIKEAVGLKAPKNIVKKFWLWLFTSHPPIYYRLKVIHEFEKTNMMSKKQ